MYLSDYHTHSRLSFDAHAPLSELAEAAADAGLDELCVTDHFDFLDENGVPVNTLLLMDPLFFRMLYKCSLYGIYMV